MIEISIQKRLQGKNGPFNLQIQTSFEENLIHAIFGKSGSGKSSIFRMIAGILPPDSGKIYFQSHCFFDSSKNFSLPIWKRKIGFVFQDYALFPHLNIYQNITFGIDTNLKNRLEEIIDLFELAHLLSQKPKHLSGGQSQKVALARAILSNPKILLLDEPFSGLDSSTKSSLYIDIKKILKHFNLTTFLISHDMAEVLLLADKIHKLEDGKLGSVKNFIPLAKNSHQDTPIIAKVLDIITHKDGVILKVFSGQVILKLHLKSISKTLKVGDEVAFDPHLCIDHIHKI